MDNSSDLESASPKELPETETTHSIDPATRVVTPSATRDDASSSELSDWDLEEDRLEAKSKNELDNAHLHLGNPPQNQPTSTIATTLQHAAPSLPAGGTQGTLLPNRSNQKVPNVAATTLKTFKSSIRKADAMYHPILEAHLHQDAMDLAIMQNEAEADAADRVALRTVDRDVVKEHLLKNGKLDRKTSIGSLLVKRTRNMSGRG
jgi:hypothetical protein